jgi:serine/threonine-protein kinase RsbW
MNPKQSIHVSADLKNLSLVRDYVQQTAEGLDVDHRLVEDVVLAVDEAVSNIILHGYKGQPGPIDLEIIRENNRLIVSVRDQAPEFDPTTVADPDLTLPLKDRKPGSLGIFLIKKMVDNIIYEPLPQGGNHLVLIKKCA